MNCNYGSPDLITGFIHVPVIVPIEQLLPDRSRPIDHWCENVNVLNTFVLQVNILTAIAENKKIAGGNRRVGEKSDCARLALSSRR
jgi:hypothetical protein